ncbi:MAG: hypothetical protein ACKVP3_28870 [Hyphomicrobiaceae bacterium]
MTTKQRELASSVQAGSAVSSPAAEMLLFVPICGRLGMSVAAGLYLDECRSVS